MNSQYPFELTPLPYGYEALEPYIDTKTVTIHHNRHLTSRVPSRMGRKLPKRLRLASRPIRPGSAGNTRLIGVQTFETLSQWTGVAIPRSNKPFISPINDIKLLAGSPLNVPIDGYDPNGGPLTYTIASSNQRWYPPSSHRTIAVCGSRSRTTARWFFSCSRISAPRPARRVIGLAQDGFYDGLTFHRVVNNFVIQGGDRKATERAVRTCPISTTSSTSTAAHRHRPAVLCQVVGRHQ